MLKNESWVDIDEFITACALADIAIDLHIYTRSDFCQTIAYQLDLNWLNWETDAVYDFGHSCTEFETYAEAREVASKMKALFVCKDFGLDHKALAKVVGKDTDSHDFTSDCGRFDWRRWAFERITDFAKSG